MQRRQLAGTQHAERFEDLRADLVLSAIAARRRRQRRPVALPAIQHHQQPVVLVVGMRRRVHEDADVAEVPQREPEGDVALLFVERDDAHLSGRNDGEGEEDDEGGQKRTPHEVIIPS